MLGETAIDPLWRRFIPADFFRHGVEHGKVLWVLGHQLAPELKRILTRGVREFIHETLGNENVVGGPNAAHRANPNAQRALPVRSGAEISEHNALVRQILVDGIEISGGAAEPFFQAGFLPAGQLRSHEASRFAAVSRQR